MFAIPLPLRLAIAVCLCGLCGLGWSSVTLAADLAADTKPSKAARDGDKSGAADEAGAIKLPEGGVKELVEFIKEQGVAPRSQAESKEFFTKTAPALRAAIDKIQEIATDEDKKLDGYDQVSKYFLPKDDAKGLIAAINKFRVFRPASVADRTEYMTMTLPAIETAGKRLVEIATPEDRKLEGYDEAVGFSFFLQARYPKGDDHQKLIADLKNYFATSPTVSPIAVQAATLIARETSAEDPARATELCREFAGVLSKSEDESARKEAGKLEGVARQLNLVGNPLEISGTTMEGKSFNLTELRGKVVLVDFWTTWCGPCRAEAPNVKKNYDLYHDKGFEVVSISLDDNREALVKYLEDEKPTWITLYDGPWKDNPNATYYGVWGVPTVILVDKEGKVVSARARGPELGKNLEELLGPPEPAAAAEAAESK